MCLSDSWRVARFRLIFFRVTIVAQRSANKFWKQVWWCGEGIRRRTNLFHLFLGFIFSCTERVRVHQVRKGRRQTERRFDHSQPAQGVERPLQRPHRRVDPGTGAV